MLGSRCHSCPMAVAKRRAINGHRRRRSPTVVEQREVVLPSRSVSLNHPAFGLRVLVGPARRSSATIDRGVLLFLAACKRLLATTAYAP